MSQCCQYGNHLECTQRRIGNCTKSYTCYCCKKSISKNVKLSVFHKNIILTIIDKETNEACNEVIDIPAHPISFEHNSEIIALVVNTYLLDGVPQLGAAINGIARKTLTITMFFIGASLSIDVLKAVGIKPLIQGILLWIIISLSTLAYIYFV